MARVLWSYTTEDAEEALGRKLAPGEAARIEKSIGHSSVGSVMAGVIDMFRGPGDWPDGDDGDDDPDYDDGSLAREDRRNAWQH